MPRSSENRTFRPGERKQIYGFGNSMRGNSGVG
jgi:hypothetical protein